MCFLELNNFINEMAYDVFNEQGVQIIPYLRKSVIDIPFSSLHIVHHVLTSYMDHLLTCGASNYIKTNDISKLVIKIF